MRRSLRSSARIDPGRSEPAGIVAGPRGRPGATFAGTDSPGARLAAQLLQFLARYPAGRLIRAAAAAANDNSNHPDRPPPVAAVRSSKLEAPSSKLELGTSNFEHTCRAAGKFRRLNDNRCLPWPDGRICGDIVCPAAWPDQDVGSGCSAALAKCRHAAGDPAPALGFGFGHPELACIWPAGWLAECQPTRHCDQEATKWAPRTPLSGHNTTGNKTCRTRIIGAGPAGKTGTGSALGGGGGGGGPSWRPNPPGRPAN